MSGRLNADGRWAAAGPAASLPLAAMPTPLFFAYLS